MRLELWFLFQKEDYISIVTVDLSSGIWPFRNVEFIIQVQHQFMFYVNTVRSIAHESECMCIRRNCIY